MIAPPNSWFKPKLDGESWISEPRVSEGSGR